MNIIIFNSKIYIGFVLIKEILSNELVSFIFKRQFGLDPDDLKSKCNIDKAEAVSRTKNELIEANKNVDDIIREKITNQTTGIELSVLTNKHCDRNETIKFLSNKLVNIAQECLQNSLDDAKNTEIIREFVTNSCAAIYNK